MKKILVGAAGFRVYKGPSWAGKTEIPAQEQFIDLCRRLGEPTPAEVNPSGDA